MYFSSAASRETYSTDVTSGNTSSDSLTVTYWNSGPEDIPPTISILSPSNGAIVSGNTNVSWTASDNTEVNAVVVYASWHANNYLFPPASEQIISVDGSISSASWNTKLRPDGYYYLKAYAIDHFGNLGKSQTVQVEADNDVSLNDVLFPIITILSPSGDPNYSTNLPTVSLSGSSSDNVGVREIRLAYYDSNSNSLSLVLMGNPITAWNFDNIPLSLGANGLIVYAVDMAGNIASATITVNRTA